MDERERPRKPDGDVLASMLHRATWAASRTTRVPKSCVYRGFPACRGRRGSLLTPGNRYSAGSLVDSLGNCRVAARGRGEYDGGIFSLRRRCWKAEGRARARAESL